MLDDKFYRKVRGIYIKLLLNDFLKHGEDKQG